MGTKKNVEMDYAIPVEQSEIEESFKLGKFTRFKPAKKKGTKSPYEKMYAALARKLGTTVKDMREEGISTSNIIIHQDDYNLIRDYEIQWILKNNPHVSEDGFAVGMYLLDTDPIGSRSEGIERGHIYLGRFDRWPKRKPND